MEIYYIFAVICVYVFVYVLFGFKKIVIKINVCYKCNLQLNKLTN
jgi:hypothetical protein